MHNHALPSGSASRRPNLESPIVLLTGVGKATPVITETVWVLAHRTPPIVPHRVVVITTKQGRDEVKKALFGQSRVWEKLRNTLASILSSQFSDWEQRLFFDPETDIRVLTRPEVSGDVSEMDDVRTQSDNEIAANAFLREVRALTADTESTLISSVAGGRKTFSSAMTTAMTTCGRRQDELTHVLVSHGLDDGKWEPDFYFPDPSIASYRKAVPPGCPEIVVQYQDIRIELGNVPFLKLGEWFSTSASSLEEAVEALDKEIVQLKANAALASAPIAAISPEQAREALQSKCQEATPLLRFLAQEPAWRKEKPFANKRVLMVLHCLSNLVSFVQGLISLGLDPTQAVLLAKDYPYPDKKRILDWLQSKQVRTGQATPESVERVLGELCAERDSLPVLVIEDGGYFLPRLVAHPILARRVIGGVEQTIRGQWNIEEAIKAAQSEANFEPAFPIVLLPESETKKEFEPPHIGRSIVKTIDAMIPEFLERMHVAVLGGAGTIGQRIVECLEQYEAQVVVFDPKLKARPARPRFRARIVDHATKAVEDARLVIGAVGDRSVDCHVIAKLKHHTYLASASSERREIDIDCLNQLARRTEDFEHPTMEKDGRPLRLGTKYFLEPDAREVILLADGLPVNFTGFFGMKDQAADLIMSLIFMAATRLAAGDFKDRKGIVPGAVDAMEKRFGIGSTYNRLYPER